MGFTDFFASQLNYRKNLGNTSDVIELPNLIRVQKESFNKFLYNESFSDLDYSREYRLGGIDKIFESVFPVVNTETTSFLEYVSSSLEYPKYSVAESLKRSVTYAASLKAVIRLIVWDVDSETEAKEIRNIKEQEVYIANLPLMTNKGTFIINGTERVIVSQLHRSPGVFFEHDGGKSNNFNKNIYSARVIPYRGSWLDFEFDIKDFLYFRIDKKRKSYITTFLKALGLDNKEIITAFHSVIHLQKVKKGWEFEFNLSNIYGRVINSNFCDPESGEILIAASTKIGRGLIRKYGNGESCKFLLQDGNLEDKIILDDFIVDGEVALKSLENVTKSFVSLLRDRDGITNIPLIASSLYDGDSSVINTLLVDKVVDKAEALVEIYKLIRSGDPSSGDTVETFFQGLFFTPEKYDLSDVGRMKIKEKFNIDCSVNYLTKDIIIEVIKELISLKTNSLPGDDIDHLSNRRVRSVGELVANQFRSGLVKMRKVIQDKMNIVEVDTIMPSDVVNQRSLNTSIREFFATSQLSQFMDQTNPLSEITHKRRLSALGPGGLSRERAGFEVRDVQPTHYGRICPIETPEGANIGLINSLSSYAIVNSYGFIETPYRIVKDGIVSNEVKYLLAKDEDHAFIAQANTEVDSEGKIVSELVSCRHREDYLMVAPSLVSYIDVSPKQMVSIAASLIPFLENDDANRALMGSNMQRQAVPLMNTNAPLVGTGMENVVAMDTGACITALRAGQVTKVDSKTVFIRAFEADDNGNYLDIYQLSKYQKSNQDTAINQKVVVLEGDVLKKGDLIADGTSTDLGELALGSNVLVGFLSWSGYNFEDSILISERLVSDDVFSSVHIKEFESIARDTRLGAEEITRDVPNVSEELLRHLDESGVVQVGAEVKTGEIIVGKITPKSYSPSTPEEKLLRAIFGEKASEVKDLSLYISPGVIGTVIDVRIFTRRGYKKSERAIVIENKKITELSENNTYALKITDKYTKENIVNLLKDCTLNENQYGLVVGSILSENDLNSLPLEKLFTLVVTDNEIVNKISLMQKSYRSTCKKLEDDFAKTVESIRSGDDLPQGVLQVIKVFVAIKRNLQVGDKMAGRHGNKGVISKIVPVEDMPYMEDGTPLDMILNSLGVPSRMNIGQIMETHLGAASFFLGRKIQKLLDELHLKTIETDSLKVFVRDLYSTNPEMLEQIDEMDDETFLGFANKLKKGVPMATPVFDGAKELDISELLMRSGVDSSGQFPLRDGRTGELFDRNVTVGQLYMLKLHHLVDEKMHARSVGPYSLVTQQPLGGKSHFGGQRFGEMECWALQAYGAAYTLQEMLTVKSDDVIGRIKLYEAVVNNERNFSHGIPESFNVMLKEMRALCLDVYLE